jgi:fructokinase
MSTPSMYPVVCIGEVLWDVLPSGMLPGGAPMNVAYHLKKLGTNPALITKIGIDEYGEKLVNILSESGISTDFFYVDYERPTGMVYAKVNRDHDVTYNIDYPSAWDFIEWKDELGELVKQADYFVFGSLSSRNKISRDTLLRLLDLAKVKVLDINLRSPHYQRENIEYLLGKTDILKMNLDELELITGWFSNFKSAEDRMKHLMDQFPIETIIVTMGGNGAMVNNKGTIYEDRGYLVNVADTIGCGDSFLAGFLHQLLNQSSVEKALSFASGIGAFIATKPGACPDYEISSVTSLINSSSKLELR